MGKKRGWFFHEDVMYGYKNCDVLLSLEDQFQSKIEQAEAIASRNTFFSFSFGAATRSLFKFTPINTIKAEHFFVECRGAKYVWSHVKNFSHYNTCAAKNEYKYAF